MPVHQEDPVSITTDQIHKMRRALSRRSASDVRKALVVTA